MSGAHTDSARRSIGRLKRAGVTVLGVGAAVLLSAGVFVAAGGATSAVAPSNSTAPTVSGTPQEAETLTVAPGSWVGDAPISFSYQWLRCDASGGSCASIIGQTATTYALKSVDVGATLRVAVTATNTDGSAVATTVPTAVVTVASTAPGNTVAPTISGVAQAGRALLANPGTWTGTAPITYSYRWEKCDKNGNSCSFVGGSTTLQAHLLAAADVGSTVRVQVTAANKAGAKTATSSQTAVVSAAAAPATGCAKNGGTIPIASVSPPARLIIDQTQVSPSAIRYGTTFVTARFHVSACGGSVQGALVYATAVPYRQFSIPNEQATDASGWATLQFSKLGGFPTSQRQQLLVMFVRARKSGENLLGGVSSRRLISFRVTR
jgi:hypothetical protein